MKRVCIVGASGHWPYAIRGLAAQPAAELVGIAPGAPGELSRVREIFSDQLDAGVPLREDYTALLDDVRPDVAVINPYFYLNGPITIQCLKRGIHCYTEKPLTFYAHELATIRELVRAGDLRLSTMLPSRYHPAFYAAYQVVQAGRIGTPIQMTAQKSYQSGTKPDWQHTRKQFGGLIGWVGAHALDWINWMCGNAVAEVEAMETRIGNHGNGEMESSSIVLIRLANGGQAAANLDYLRPAGAATHGDDRLRVAGTDGVVEVRGGRARLITADSEEIELPLEPQPEMFAEFLKCIDDTGYPYRQSLDDVYALTELCMRAQDAADARRTSPSGS